MNGTENLAELPIEERQLSGALPIVRRYVMIFSRKKYVGNCRSIRGLDTHSPGRRRFIMVTPGPWELMVILLIVMVVFGAKRLPEIGKGMGKGIREFKQSLREISDDEEPETPSRIEGNARTEEPKQEEKSTQE